MYARRFTITGQDVKHSIAIGPQGVVTGITEQLAGLRSRVRAAARRAGRAPESVRILAVSKRQPVESVRVALAAGLNEFGENYVPEGLEKIAAGNPGAIWHFIGQLQSNKTRAVAEHFDWVQTVATARIAERLSAQRSPGAADLQLCIQLRPEGGMRSGAEPDSVPALAEQIAQLPRVRLRGLMVMPLPHRSEPQLRAEFAAGRELFETLQRRGHQLDTLSMGMSADLEAAIMEGSTMIRIGTALFGPRPAA